MTELAKRLFGFRSPVNRRFYLLVGCSLMIGKYLVDALVVYLVTGILWTPIDYLIPLLQLRAEKVAAFPLWFSIALVVWTLPFIWIGASMTFRRAVDAGYSPWLVLWFFVPILNYLLMLALCALPSASEPMERAALRPSTTRLQSALLGMMLSLVIASAGIGISVYVLSSYGLAVFVFVPFILGVVATYVFNLGRSSTARESIWVALLALLLLGGTLILFAFEGLICVAMAVPLAVPIVLLGGVLGREIALRSSPRLFGLFSCLLFLPVVWVVDVVSPPSPTYEVTTTIEISAPPESVWQHVVAFDEIEQEPERYFQLGIAYPIRARIEGEGIGAVRYCEFSTGAFVEPITAWEEPYRLAFDVTEQPASLQELSFYENVNAPHVHDFFRSTRGEFRLIAIDNDRTRLEGTTWYDLHIYPHVYWRPISEWLVERIHERVLHQIAQEATESAA